MPLGDIPGIATQWMNRRRVLRTFVDYYEGRHELKFASVNWRSTYGQSIGEQVLSIRENLCPAVIDAFVDGIDVTDWGTGDANDTALIEGLSRLQSLVTREAWKTGDAFVLVWPGNDGQPAASFQPAQCMIPHVDPIEPDRLDWCAKVWIDYTTKLGRINIYTPAGVERWQTATELPLLEDPEHRQRVDLPVTQSSWVPCIDEDGDWIAHDFGAVPVVWFKRDAPAQDAHGVSILNDVIPLQDGLNKSLADMMVTSEAYSRPFWYLLNVRPPQPVNPLLATTIGPGMATPAPTTAGAVTNATPTWQAMADMPKRFDPQRQRIFTHDGPGPFGQLDPPDLTLLLKVQDGFALKVARVVGVPAYYFTQTSGDVPSGESLRVLSMRRSGRIRAWQRDNGPAWQGVKHLLGMGDEPIAWADPMPLDESEKMAVAAEKKALGYSLQDVVDYLGEPDAAGIVQRAQQATADQQQLARQFMQGVSAGNY